MIIKNERPPAWIYDSCIKQFNPPRGTVYSFADTIFNPDGIDIPDHLIVHESVHGEQQKHDELVAKFWWERYLADPQFRVEQEIEHTTSNTNTSAQKSKTKILASEICICSPNLCVRLCTVRAFHIQTPSEEYEHELR